MKDDQTKVAGMAKQEIIGLVKEWAERLGHVPSLAELLKQRKISLRTMRKYFGTMLERSKNAGWSGGAADIRRAWTSCGWNGPGLCAS